MSFQGRIVVLTGAGISAESGLKTFRDHDGLWENMPVHEVATPEAFERHPDKVHSFYNERRKQLLDSGIRPNPAHQALAQLEHHVGSRLLVITQNVDNLHERSGSSRVLHMHGSLLEARCQNTHAVHPWIQDTSTDLSCPSCQTPGCLRPHIVWFGETPLGLPRIYDALESCDLFVAIGTSGEVYPASGFVDHVRRLTQARCVELNLKPSAISAMFHDRRFGPASDTVPTFVSELLAKM